MKHYYGNHLGICINNVDPENRGRVQIFIPNIMPALYEGWNELGEDIKLECVGDNLPNGLSSEIVAKLTQILPWAEAATPVIGNSVAGTYNPETGNFNQTSTPEAAATTFDLNSNPRDFSLNLSGTQKNAANSFVNNFNSNKDKYSAVSANLRQQGINMSPEQVAALHWREASGSFTKSIANGQRLGTNIRKDGRLGQGSGADAFSNTTNWVQNATEVLAYKVNEKKNFTNTTDFSKQGSFYKFAEAYNGLGYQKRGQPSPYVYAGTSGYQKGKFVADGKYNPNYVDQQLGVAAMTQLLGQGSGFDINNPASAPEGSGLQPSRNPFYTSQEPYQVQREPTEAAVTQVNAPTPVGGKGNLQTALSKASASTGVKFVRGKYPGMCAKATRSLANVTLGVGGHFGPIGPIGGSAKDTIGKNYWEKEYRDPVTGKKGSLYERISTNNYVPQEGDIGITTGGKHGHAKIVVGGQFRSDRIDDGPAHLNGSSTAAVYRLTPLGQELYARTGLGDATALGQPVSDMPNTGDDGTGIATDDASSQLVRNPTETQATALDTTGMAQGMFGIPGPGAMLWVFFREGDPMFPVYFAASYGASEWQSAYQASSPPAYGPQENNSNSISNQSVYRPNNAGAITFTGAVNTEKDSRAVRLAHANGGYLEFHPHGSVHYSPNEHLQHVGGTDYKYCLNKEDWVQGNSNNVVIGNQWVVIGNPSQANIETIEKLTQKVKEVNAEMMRN